MSEAVTCDTCSRTTLKEGAEPDLEMNIRETNEKEDQCTCTEIKQKLFQKPLSKLSKPSDAIRNFAPSWFSITMGTGILSILLENFPFQFHGLHTIAIVLFLMNLLFYSIFTLMSLARYLLFPSIIGLMLNHSSESLFIGAIPMGLTTLINFIVVGLTQHFDWALDLAFILWVINLFSTLISCLVVPYYVVARHTLNIESMNGTWFLPIVPAIVSAASGGLLANHLDEQRGLVVLMISYALMGTGLLLAMFIMGIYYYRLIMYKIPSKEVIFSSVILLGPLGQGAYGMVQIGSASLKIFGTDRYIPGLGATAYGLGFLLAVLLWGCGVWFLIVSIFSVWFRARQERIPFNMGWWSMGFPFGAFVAATLSIGNVMGSMFFLVLAAIFICMLVLIWLMLMVKTIPAVWSGELFYSPCLNQPILRQ